MLFIVNKIFHSGVQMKKMIFLMSLFLSNIYASETTMHRVKANISSNLLKRVIESNQVKPIEHLLKYYAVDSNRAFFDLIDALNSNKIDRTTAEQIANLFIKYGVDITKMYNKMTPFMYAVYKHNSNAIEIMIKVINKSKKAYFRKTMLEPIPEE